MKWRIDDAAIFVAAAERNGISAAARHLNMPKSSVSAAISRLEQSLGLRLMHRSSRSLRITREGETFYRYALTIVEQAREADAAMAGLTAAPSGRLTVALPSAFAQEVVGPSLARFAERFPDIELDLQITSQGAELVRDQVDIAIVVGPLEDSGLITRTLVAGQLVWVASPDYAARLPENPTPQEISGHVRICEKRYGLARLPAHIDNKAAHLDLLHGISHVNDPLVVRQAVVNGAGVSVLPRRYCRKELEAGTLVEVFRNVRFDLSASKLSAIYPDRRLISPRIRVFIDFVSELCGEL